MRTLFGESILEILVNKVKWFVDTYKPDTIYMFFSGGKDSLATLLATIYSGNAVVRRLVIVFNEITGNTHPKNIKQVYRVLDKLGLPHPVVVESPPYIRIKAYVLRGDRTLHIAARNRHGEDFWSSMLRWGIPVKLKNGKRWCYNEFKEKHWRYLPYHVTRYEIIGIKRSDSHFRLRAWQRAVGGVRTVTKADGTKVVQFSPIIDLTDEQVWWAIKEAGLEHLLETYKLCGDSLNCMFCPLRNMGKQQRVVEWLAKNSPEALLKARQVLEKLAKDRGSVSSQIASKWLEMVNNYLDR